MKIIKNCRPATENYLKEGLRLALLNIIILMIGGGIGLGLFWIVNLVRKAGFPLTLPVWLITIGMGVPYFVICFQYGKAFGCLTKERYIIRGATVALLGDMPAIGCLYILINTPPDFLITQEIQRIVLILLLMLVIMMPIMTVLGVLDIKKAGSKK